VRTIVVMPTYNERENVSRLLGAVRSTLPEADILVVDDHSPDGTASLVEEVAAELGQIKLLRRPGKHGLGSAYREGFAIALDEGYDAIVSMDVDFSHDPASLPDLLRLLDAGADAVIGSRYVPGGDTVDWPVHRRGLSRWGNRYAALALGLAVNDSTSGYRAYRADALRRVDFRVFLVAVPLIFLELVLRGLRSSTPRHLRESLALIASGAVECESLVDCVLGLEAFDEGLARYMRRQALKVVFAP